MPNYKKINILIAITGLLLLLKGVLDPVYMRFCQTDCDEFIVFILLGVFFILISTSLFFLRREVFIAWAKFASVGIPLMLGGLLYAFHVPQSTGTWIGGPTESQIASILLPSLFFVISLIIIITKSFALRKKE